jgi:hypothetical protein
VIDEPDIWRAAQLLIRSSATAKTRQLLLLNVPKSCVRRQHS